MERLQKVIANSGFCSRRKAEEIIMQGRVKVDGETIRELGVKVLDKSIIEIDGMELQKDKKVYYLLNKPRGVVTTTNDDKNRKTVVDLIPTSLRIYPIGRLDYDTTGVLLLTNDGEFANLMMHPSSNIEKTYIAKVEGLIKGDAIQLLKKGVEVDGTLLIATRVKLRKSDLASNTSMVEITIQDGHNHQVKNMFKAVGFPVIKLKRERFGFITVGNLASGEYRELTKKEIHQLYAFAKRK